MISRAIIVWVLLVIGTILISVQIGLKAEALDDNLKAVERKQEVERDRIRVLRASYAYLTASDQLQPLVQRHLVLEPIRGDQMVTLADLPVRVPVPVSKGQEPGADAPSVKVPTAPVGPRTAEAPSQERSNPPRNSDKNPPWLKAKQGPVLQPVGLPSQKRSSL